MGFAAIIWGKQSLKSDQTTTVIALKITVLESQMFRWVESGSCDWVTRIVPKGLCPGLIRVCAQPDNIDLTGWSLTKHFCLASAVLTHSQALGSHQALGYFWIQVPADLTFDFELQEMHNFQMWRWAVRCINGETNMMCSIIVQKC